MSDSSERKNTLKALLPFFLFCLALLLLILGEFIWAGLFAVLCAFCVCSLCLKKSRAEGPITPQYANYPRDIYGGSMGPTQGPYPQELTVSSFPGNEFRPPDMPPPYTAAVPIPGEGDIQTQVPMYNPSAPLSDLHAPPYFPQSNIMVPPTSLDPGSSAPHTVFQPSSDGLPSYEAAISLRPQATSTNPAFTDAQM